MTTTSVHQHHLVHLLRHTGHGKCAREYTKYGKNPIASVVPHPTPPTQIISYHLPCSSGNTATLYPILPYSTLLYPILLYATLLYILSFCSCTIAYIHLFIYHSYGANSAAACSPKSVRLGCALPVQYSTVQYSTVQYHIRVEKPQSSLGTNDMPCFL